MTKPPAFATETDFYAEAIRLLQGSRIPFLVGGAYALRQYTGIVRDTKDFDVFIRPGDLDRALETFRNAHYHAEVSFPHWLAKVHHGEIFIDLIYRAGNGLCEVDDAWFRSSEEAELLGERVRLVTVEDMIWQKAYIMERERFDGADVAHLLQSRAERLDWDRLLKCFGPDWRVLLSHLILFGFIYPGERQRIPHVVLARLLRRVHEELDSPGDGDHLCQGTLISRAQYLPDIERWDYRDARTLRGKITAEEIEKWTSAIGRERAWA